MKYKNAYEGMKKIVAAEALQIISAGLAIIVALLGVTALTVPLLRQKAQKRVRSVLSLRVSE